MLAAAERLLVRTGGASARVRSRPLPDCGPGRPPAYSADTTDDGSDGHDMGILSKLTKLGIAKKAVDEARKPENQRRAKEMLAKARNRGTGTRPRP